RGGITADGWGWGRSGLPPSRGSTSPRLSYLARGGGSFPGRPGRTPLAALLAHGVLSSGAGLPGTELPLALLASRAKNPRSATHTATNATTKLARATPRCNSVGEATSVRWPRGSWLNAT